MSEKLNTEADYRNDVQIDEDPLAELARIVAGEPEPVLETAPASDPAYETAPQIPQTDLHTPTDPQPIDQQPVDVSVEAALEDALASDFAVDMTVPSEPEPPQGAQDITEAVNMVADPDVQTQATNEAFAQQAEPEAFEDSLISALQDDFSADAPAQAEAIAPADPVEEIAPAPVEQEFVSFEDELSAQLEDQTAVSIEQVAQELTEDISSVETVHASAPQPNLEEDLGAAFDKEFENMLVDAPSQEPLAAVAEDVAPAAEPVFEADLIQEPVVVSEFEQQLEPVADFSHEEMPVSEQPEVASLNELDFGSAFAEELGVEEIPEQSGWAEGETQASHSEFSAAAEPQFSDEPYVDPGHDGDVPAVPAGFGSDTASQKSGGSQRYAVAALVIALFAGSIVAGYGFLGGGDTTTSGEPVVIQADSDPVKVKPDDPGGRVVANQDKATFTKVDGETDEGINQESLISNTEEPAVIEPAQSEAANIAGAETNLPEKTDDRLSVGGDEVSDSDPSNSSVTPRVVQTVTVKPDGTILTSTPTVPSVSDAVEVASNTLGQVQENVGNLAASALPAATPVPTAVIAKPEPIDGAQTSGSLAVPAVSPIPKPAPAPVALAPAPAPAPAPVAAAPTASPEPAAAAPVRKSEWVVQVSSQRSAEAAQASFQNLRNRFSALQGRSMSIQRANVNGSTFYRVRVQTASRNDANQLCTGLKSSGGSCFVTR